MAQRLKISETNAALAALLSAVMSAAYTQTVDVKESSKDDFNDDGELVLSKVAIRIAFGQAEYSAARDISQQTLSASLTHQVVCRHESLRGGKETRSRSLALVDCAMEQLAGARLLLANGTKSAPISIVGVFPVSDRGGIVEDCYGITIEVSGFAQFSGVNSVPVAQGAA